MSNSILRRWRHCDATHGVTLVELLVTIMIIGILSSSVLFAMSVAQESARKARTQVLIASLHSLVVERWESYLTKRFNLDYLQAEQLIDLSPSRDRRFIAGLRLKTARQFQKMDFPDQWSDISELTSRSDSMNENAVSSIYHRHTWYLDSTNSTVSNQGAECLYIISASIRSEGAKWRKVDESFIGDTDGDGAPEFLDGWGRPVEFIRWPAGFPSDLQMGQPAPPSPKPPSARVENTALVQQAAKIDHDPFDPFLVKPLDYRLVPLIFSAGPDGIYDIVKPLPVYTDNTFLSNRWNPYFLFDWTDEVGTRSYRRMGEPYDVNKDGIENWHDNIHNHLISTR